MSSIPPKNFSRRARCLFNNATSFLGRTSKFHLLPCVWFLSNERYVLDCSQLVRVPPNQRWLMKYWPARTAFATASAACFLVPTNKMTASFAAASRMKSYAYPHIYSLLQVDQDGFRYVPRRCSHLGSSDEFGDRSVHQPQEVVSLKLLPWVVSPFVFFLLSQTSTCSTTQGQRCNGSEMSICCLRQLYKYSRNHLELASYLRDFFTFFIYNNLKQSFSWPILFLGLQYYMLWYSQVVARLQSLIVGSNPSTALIINFLSSFIFKNSQ